MYRKFNATPVAPAAQTSDIRPIAGSKNLPPENRSNMNHYGAKQMAASWRTVRNNTIQTAEDIPADKYNYRVSPDTMTVAEMLAHMTMSPHWAQQVHMVEKKHAITREDFGKYREESNAIGSKLTTKDAIVAELKTRGEQFATLLEGMSDAQLGEMVESPGGAKSRFEMLLGSKEHEMHHRAQLMQMQRLLGIVPHLTRARQAQMAAMQQAQTA